MSVLVYNIYIERDDFMKLCVYGAASKTIDKVYIEKCEELGRKLSERGHGLIFGAGGNGVMGAVARGCYSGGGEIIGIVPSFFNVDGIIFENSTETIRVETMRERKRLMEEMSDGFIVAPGGIGTFDEFFEILTLKQLSRHCKPIVIFNVNHYYDSLISFLQNSIDQNFLKEGAKKLYHICSDADEVFDYIENYEPVEYDILEMKEIK